MTPAAAPPRIKGVAAREYAARGEPILRFISASYIAWIFALSAACAHQSSGLAEGPIPSGTPSPLTAHADPATAGTDGDEVAVVDPAPATGEHFVEEVDSLLEDTPDAEAIDSPAAVEEVEGIPLVYNDRVQRFMHYFQNNGRERFELWLSRSGAYIPLMQEILVEEGLPPDLVYLALIESGFSPHAYSVAAAAGYWQFIASTGKRYGLRIDHWVDERRNPVKATRAAARYLKDLYELFGDWHLAAASYNAGEGRIARAIRRYRTQDYWKLIEYRHLARETRDYVPKLMAAITLAKNPQNYGFSPQYMDPLDFTTVSVAGGEDLTRLAFAADVSYAELKRLNPELRRWVTPPDQLEYALAIPTEAAEGFFERLMAVPATVSTPMREITLAKGDTLERIASVHRVEPDDVRYLNPDVAFKAGARIRIPIGQDGTRLADRPRTIVKYVRVRSGDTLSGIARRHRVDFRKLARYNGIRPNSILRVGQTLKIPVRGSAVYSGSAKSSGGKIVKVRRGDTLYGIARRYRVSPSQLANANGLSHDAMLRIGQRLKIP